MLGSGRGRGVGGMKSEEGGGLPLVARRVLYLLPA